MSDFLQSLVLRAAGLPLTAVPQPRTLPAAEPMEMAPEEEVEPPAGETPAVRERAERERKPDVTLRHPGIIEPEGAPKSVIEQFSEMQERPPEAREPEPPPLGDVRPIVEAQSPLPPSEPTRVIEREVLRERERPAPRESAGPEMTVQPPVPAIEVPRETIVERELVAAPAAEETPREREPAPVMLQPIVIDQTRTIVEPLREERTVVETRTERVVVPPAERPEPDEAQEPQPPRTAVEPRVAAPQAEAPRDAPRAIERPEVLVEPPSESERALEAVPRTLVLPQPPVSAAEDAQQQPEPEVAIHIGTIEIRAAAPPPPAPAPRSITITRAPEPPSNFDAYASLRNYQFPDVW
jgi:hypothetical protein